MSITGLYDQNFSEEGLFSFFFRSFLGHVIAFALFALITFGFDFFGSGLEEENISLVDASVRVDVVAMPKMTVKELQALQSQASQKPKDAPAAPVKEEAVAEPEVKKVADDSKAPVLNQEEKKPKSVSDILKQAASRNKGPRAKKAAESSSREEGLTDAARKRLQSLVAAGNKVSEGSSISGSGNSSAEMTAFTNYISQLPEMVRPNWRLPSYLMDQDLRCRVRIYLSSDGGLIKAEVYESSGNDEYDDRAISAVRATSPFPPMDEEIASRGVRGDILLGFPL